MSGQEGEQDDEDEGEQDDEDDKEKASLKKGDVTEAVDNEDEIKVC